MIVLAHQLQSGSALKFKFFEKSIFDLGTKKNHGHCRPCVSSAALIFECIQCRDASSALFFICRCLPNARSVIEISRWRTSEEHALNLFACARFNPATYAQGFRMEWFHFDTGCSKFRVTSVGSQSEKKELHFKCSYIGYCVYRPNKSI